MKNQYDKNGEVIKSSSTVNVPASNGTTDIHLCEFQGTVADILDNGNVIVEDKDSNFYEIESSRLEVVAD